MRKWRKSKLFQGERLLTFFSTVKSADSSGLAARAPFILRSARE